MNGNKLKNILERSAIEIIISLAIKVVVILCYLQVVEFLLPIAIFSGTSVVLTVLAILLWFFELEGELLSSLIISHIISARKGALDRKKTLIIDILNNVTS